MIVWIIVVHLKQCQHLGVEWFLAYTKHVRVKFLERVYHRTFTNGDVPVYGYNLRYVGAVQCVLNV